MNLTRQPWDPFRHLSTMNDPLFTRMLDMFRPSNDGGRETMSATNWAPAVDICETEKEYCISAELPGVQKNDVQVTLDNGCLTIRGSRREQIEEKNTRWHRRELAQGSFVRQFSLPDDAEEGKVDATFKDGILTVTIPKMKTKAPSPKQIAVH
jgi:HSP20 family protein